MKYTVIIFFLGLCGCASTGLFSKTGSAFVSVQTESGGVAYNKGDIKATGEACSYNVLGIVAIGDSSINPLFMHLFPREKMETHPSDVDCPPSLYDSSYFF